MEETQSINFSQFYGVYRGFTPTDESPLCMGELEVSITQEAFNLRAATGLKIEEMTLTSPQITPLTRDEVGEQYLVGSSFIDRTVGYKMDWLNLLFIPDAGKYEFGLIIRNMGMADLLGPTMLYNPKQVREGLHKKAMRKLKFASGRTGFPTLRAKGQLESNILFKLINGVASVPELFKRREE